MFKEILLPIDLAHDSSYKQALPVALDLCKHHGATLHIMTVVPDFGMSIVGQFFPKGYEEDVSKKVLEALHDFTKANLPPDIPCHHIVAEGTVYEVILKIAKKINADLIVMGAHRAELKDYLLGPNAARVVRHADCSVMVVRD